ncbi:hypothetical protein [Actinomadura flavalba]|uniref:hypothetical protein n=1 Tax=Actinomadura flavalba TaxID=1120938 RepID=UPI00037E1DA4|nr:hypothetical protein [Actinomadura flavalba]
MTAPRDHADAESLAAAVLSIPGVACLKPGVKSLLFSHRDRTDLTGLRITEGPGTTRIDVQIIAHTNRPIIATTRHVRQALLTRTAPDTHVTVTVTGTLE